MAFLRAFPFSACIYACFTLSGLYGVYTRFSGAARGFRSVSRFPVPGAAWPVSLPSSGAGVIYARGACFAAWIISRRGFSSGAGRFSAGAFSAAAGPFPGLFGRLLPVCFHSAFGACFRGCRRFSIGISACFRGRGRSFSIVFPGLFPGQEPPGGLTFFSAAGAGKVKELCIEQIFKCPAGAGSAPPTCTRARIHARPPGAGIFPSCAGKGKQGKFIVYAHALDAPPPPNL